MASHRLLLNLGILLGSLSVVASPHTAAETTIRVPGDHATIQAAIDAAGEGDTVLVAAGTWRESLTVSGRRITLASYYHTTGDERMIARTVIDGGGSDWAIRIEPSASEITIRGFTIRNAIDGLSVLGSVACLDNRVTDTEDGIDYDRGGGGLVRNSIFEKNRDDGIDLDDDAEVVIEGSTIRNNRQDGIEIRLHDHDGPRLSVVIRDNVISDNGEDGIQFIGYDDTSFRVFRIERNLLLSNTKAGIGMVDRQETYEDFRAASVAERIDVVNNTFVGNDHGISGGDNVVVLNNLFVSTRNTALKYVDGESVIAHNLFFRNGVDAVGSNIDDTTVLKADPRLGADHRLRYGSPAIDAGIARLRLGANGVLSVESADYLGPAPDLGAFEYRRRLIRQGSTHAAP